MTPSTLTGHPDGVLVKLRTGPAISRPVIVELDFLDAFEAINGLLLRRARLEELHASVLDPESSVIEAALERVERAENAIRRAAGLGGEL